MKAFVYRLIFKNGKSYVGITTTSPALRMQRHAQAAIKGRFAVYKAWRKHGAPEVSLLACATNQADILWLEKHFIAEFKAFGRNGYNMTPGGDTNPMTVPELARRAGDANKGRKHTEEARKNMGLSRKGKKLTAEHRRKISDGQRGNTRGDECREKIRKKAIGRTVSEQTRARQSIIRKGKPSYERTPESRESAAKARRDYWERMRRENPEELQRIISKSAFGIKAAWARRKCLPTA